MMNEMNYRYNNPTQDVFSPDVSLTKAFASKPRTPEAIEHFKLWASMSKDANIIMSVLPMVQVMEQAKQVTK